MRGQSVKQLRKVKAWSQAHLAEASGVSIRTIQRMEKTGQCSDETLLAIAAALDIDVETLSIAAPMPSAALQPTPPTTTRFLWAEITPRHAFLGGGLLLLPAVLFILSNLLKYQLDVPHLYDLLVSLGQWTGLDRFASLWTSPALLLGGPFVAALLSLLAQLRVRGDETEDGFEIKGLTISFNMLSSLMLVGALAALTILVGYATVENLADWILDIVKG